VPLVTTNTIITISLIRLHDNKKLGEVVENTLTLINLVNLPEVKYNFINTFGDTVAYIVFKVLYDNKGSKQNLEKTFA
jgi:hypothetical protein